MAKRKKKRQTVAQLVREIIRISPDNATRARALKLKGRSTLSMAHVLERVPGDSVSAKCRKLGISRQSYYYWIEGKNRPSKSKAELLAKLTGYNAANIRGYHPLASPPASTPSRVTAGRI